MTDPYLYENTSVLRNLLNIRDSADLDLVEAEQASINMLTMYETGFSDFTANGLCEIHRRLFGDIYDWAGKFRVINIKKSEKVLAGTSVWYSDVDSVEKDLDKAWNKIHCVKWTYLAKNIYVEQLVRCFSEIWQVHPFREGNTRTLVMMLTFFVESHGYFVDRDLFAASAGYVRNSFVLASIDQYSEYEHLEKILRDAILDNPPQYSDEDIEEPSLEAKSKHSKYATMDYTPAAHEYRTDDEVECPDSYRGAKGPM